MGIIRGDGKRSDGKASDPPGRDLNICPRGSHPCTFPGTPEALQRSEDICIYNLLRVSLITGICSTALCASPKSRTKLPRTAPPAGSPHGLRDLLPCFHGH